MGKDKRNRGVILISVFLVAGVILTLSCAYVVSSIVQGRAALAQVEAAKAVYFAEQGIESAYIESGKNSWAYHTHTVNAGNELVKASPAPAAPTLQGWSINSSTGCYEQAVANGKIEVKTYADPEPLREDETLVLVRSSIGRTVRIFRFRISRRSLYRYFIFWPADFSVNFTGTIDGKQIDGNNVGALHVNGNIIFNYTTSTVNFRNFSEFSCSGNISYPFYSSYLSPYGRDISWWNSVTHTIVTSGGAVDGIAPIPRDAVYPYNFQHPFPTDAYLGVTNSYHIRTLFQDPSCHFYGWDTTDDYLEGANYANTIHGLTSINSIQIPKQLAASYAPPTWSVQKYSGTRQPTERAVEFEITNEALAWLANIENGNNPNAINKYQRAISLGNWLSSGDANANNQWENNEFDKITLLSVEQETGDGPGSLSNPYGYGRGLWGTLTYPSSREYNIYSAVTSGSYPVDMPPELTSWIQNYGGAGITMTLGQFFDWWKARRYHHQEALTLGGSVYHFATDSATVPAWKRLFWEAWVNYWPPAHSKSHSQVYIPAQSYNQGLNSEWWQDLQYGTDRATTEATLDIKYLNTVYQGGQFSNWLIDHGLDTVIKYANYGGQYETPLDITASYTSFAQSGGLYIKENTAGPAFTLSFNGNTASGSLAACLAALGLDTWISAAQFYDPYGHNKNYYNYNVPPDPIQVIQLDFAALISSGQNVNNHLIYIDSLTYDTRIVNAATLPSGGFTLVTPYNVYVKAQQKAIGATTVNAFNYEVTHRVNSSDPLDANFQPAAVITNSDVFLLSSQFIDFDPDNGDPYPYSDNFPYSVPLSCAVFLQDYCWDNWPAPPFPGRPAAKSGLTPAWVSANLTPPQQTTLTTAGQTQWDTVNETKKINRVTRPNIFNLAVASYNEPRPSYRERWFTGSSSTLEGAFIKLGSRWSSSYRNFYDCRYYEGFRFSLPNGPPPSSNNYLYGYKINPPSPSYRYQERFWEAEERPSADFFAGSQAVWQEVPSSESNFTYHVP